MTDPSSNQQAFLRPRARIMRTLGDELISSEVVAVIELVKNAYDADATRVLVRFRTPLEVGRGGIDIIDDGHGMSLETIERAWLEPATPYRRDAPRSESLGRHVLGEKGIGRFAVSKLADELELISRRAGADVETTVAFDWSAFDDDDAYLDDIAMTLVQNEPREITPGGAIDALWAGAPRRPGHGTLLRMSKLRMPWTEARISELRKGLSRLVSPFLFEQQRDSPDAFTIVLDVPGFPQYSGDVEPPETIRNPHYSIKARVGADATFTASIRLRGETTPIERSGSIRGFDVEPPECGEFEVELRVWDRDTPSLSALAHQTGTTTAQARRDLNDAAGVSIYRDGFRVLPYGEKGNDWLSLDSRRVNNPTLRISNNQVVGYVLITRDANGELRDQTNREGLIDNKAFADLRAELTAVIAQLEAERYAVRPREERRTQTAGGGLFAGLDLAAVKAYVSERYPGDSRLAGLLGDAQENLEEGVARAQEVVARYRRLATLGELVDKVLHDGRAPLAKMGSDADLALRDIDRGELPCDDLLAAARGRFARIRKQHDVLAAVLRRIEPFGGRRRGRPSPREIEDVLAESFAVLDTDLRAIGADVVLPETRTTVTADETELQQVFVNLLRNSIYWLRMKPQDERKIQVAVSRDDDGLHILFSDSGPGVDPAIREHIFDPYFSTSENGVGLGLSIAGEIVEEYYGGRLSLVDPGPLPGANFKVTLRRRV
jgi:signal transduction histidine kinase